MAKRSAVHKTITPTATADTVDLVDSTYPFAIQGATATQKTNIIEIYLGGQAGASTPTFMLLARDSQVATGSLTKDTTLNDSALDAATTALASIPTIFNKAATLKPRRDTAVTLLNLSFNAFGGIVRWVAAPGEEISVVGNTASLGECSLSAFTGGTAGLLGSHMIFETF
jgi:hypothetical protein